MSEAVSALDAYRAVLHTWAAKQLTERSLHTGPFTITQVRVESVHGYSVGNDYLEIGIGFTHTDCSCRTWDGKPMESGWWSMPDTTDSVTVLNELLALGDAR